MPLSLQRLLPADWPALAALIHDLNRRPGGGIRCLHAAHGADVASHAAELASLPPDEAAFWSIDQGDTRVGMLGCEFDPASGRAWLRGPLAAEPAVLDELLPLAGLTLEAALPGIRRFDAFPSADDEGLNAWYAAAGFTALLVHTVLRAPTGPQRGSPLPNVRRAAPSDLPAVWALHEALFPEGYLAEADFRRALDPDADRALFVAADEHDAPVGYLHVQDNDADHEAYVDYLGIDEARRGRGLGRTLLEAASGWGAQRGRPHVALTVREDRRSAQALYRNAGFAEISVGRHWRKDLGAASR
jgi:ribosomal protein S18 acetylase RimI-like enzyme